ncbi:hypothetical protein H7J87_28135 [Mycolicibacterium wolinskyi]|uniref:ApeA N-terminal domain-containing protein n=2 Tax=Mycobacteriaceae TaxID=1762 RepID=A0A1X2FDH2_9MYCO|nr:MULTISPECIES: hypothetical protein [Mycolicibacterium]MCV7289201.1 hypothetical protein [Mycolicibacterium wolinskyi]MCV7294228.1 hypothetical protein [Mycolicibacterium goodii]ORX16483.1 hypothetical protein AWC31_20785 [Mycolicibacterium wolinskyi]
MDTLLQLQMRRRFLENGGSAWTTVYRDWHNDESNGAEFAAFAPPSYRETAISDAEWDLSIGGGMPGFTQYYTEGRPEEPTYLQFGNTSGIEPIVIVQEHHGGKPKSLPQVAEHFRLYHNLWPSPNGAQLIKLDDDGTEYIAAEITMDEVRIRTKLLRQYQAGRQLDLLTFVDSVQFVPSLKGQTVDYKSLSEQIRQIDCAVDFNASHGRTAGLNRPFSRLLGTKVIEPPAREFAGISPYENERENYPEFIIGESDNGEEIRHSCDPEKLANYFGKNPESPHYLTPVYFRRDVLVKYYDEPEKYSVGDGSLSCGYLWGVRVDNDHPDYVMVFLGDLGRDLPSAERDYWRSYNISPTGAMSDTNYRRSFLSQPVDPQAADLRLKQLYSRFRRDWKARYGWDLFRDPVAADEHVLKRLRVPLNNSQPEFEGQVMNMAKVLVDSLNESKLQELLGDKVEGEKGIAKLKRWLEHESYPDPDAIVTILQRVQRLRSRVAAHRKGSDYESFVRAELGDEGSVRGVSNLMAAASEMLVALRAVFLA